MKLLVFTEGTLLIPLQWAGLPREAMVELSRNGHAPSDYSAQLPAGGAVGKLWAWRRGGAEIAYLTSRTAPAEVEAVRGVLERLGFPEGPLYFRQAGEQYQHAAERAAPDVIVEDDCESIGGEAEMTYPHLPPHLKALIKSVIVPEFGGLDHLPDDLAELLKP